MYLLHFNVFRTLFDILTELLTLLCLVEIMFHVNQKSTKYLKQLKGQALNCQKVLFRPVDRDVFVRDLNRQLGTPSHWLAMDSCKKEDKEAP